MIARTLDRIAAAYDDSSWFRLLFILVFAAIGNAGAWVVFKLMGTTHVAAAVVVVWILVLACCAAHCIVRPAK